MGDDESGAAFHHFVERGVEPGFGQRVERAGRFVEDEDRRIFEQCPGHREALPLAASDTTRKPCWVVANP
jgi:hypothetical protein